MPKKSKVSQSIVKLSTSQPVASQTQPTKTETAIDSGTCIIESNLSILSLLDKYNRNLLVSKNIVPKPSPDDSVTLGLMGAVGIKYCDLADEWLDEPLIATETMHVETNVNCLSQKSVLKQVFKTLKLRPLIEMASLRQLGLQDKFMMVQLPTSYILLEHADYDNMYTINKILTKEQMDKIGATCDMLSIFAVYVSIRQLSNIRIESIHAIMSKIRSFEKEIESMEVDSRNKEIVEQKEADARKDVTQEHEFTNSLRERCAGAANSNE